MYNKLRQQKKKENKKLESTKIRQQIADRIHHQGGKYTTEQEVDMIKLEDEFKKRLEELRIDILKKNLKLFN